MIRIFDTHVHLLDERFDEDRNRLIEDLPACGIAAVMEACCDEPSMDRVDRLCAAYGHVYGSVGVHPHSASDWNDGTLKHMEMLLSANEKIRAVGEIGLDYHYDFSPRDVQRSVFDLQLSFACERNIPVIIHDREAHGDCMDLLRQYRGRLSGIMHCFSGSYETARECIDDGLYVAFGGALTFKNASVRREIAAKLPLDRLLLETDCPYMTPEPLRGTRNEPKLTELVLKTLWEIRPESPEMIAETILQNSLDVFRIKSL